MIASAVTLDTLRSIWVELLGLTSTHDVADTANFLDLGGDSIAAALCLNRIRSTFNIEISMLLFLAEDMTLARLAREIDMARAACAT
jgi:acyl carrier protein